MDRDVVDEILDSWRAELPAVAGLALELGKRAARLGAILGEAASVQLSRFGLTKAEYEVLAVLRAAGRPYRLRPSDLTARLLLSSGGTSNLLRRMAETNLIEREADPRDARSSWVCLTGKGVRTAEEAVVATTAAQERLLRSVPDQTVRSAADALRAVLLALGDISSR